MAHPDTICLTNFEGTRFYWRATETADKRWQPYWGSAGRGASGILWRSVGRPRLEEADALKSAKQYAEYISRKM